ncbi:glycosyl hydrolase [Verminephrobacter aporrectodeae subsp. tuberculatae]|uniref:Ig-like domain-containing protein n=1 Tax=Verminephrobacter aporrectodeae TaxID=1110389 RepID=UPI0022448E4B|nr:Ig-like domain-containing protein [Verminephrobacter aporrectodeae]MCW8208757.1 glycosyl hydrolase [Verminephrobacter aporrectodeae subsp. tuberculatae]
MATTTALTATITISDNKLSLGERATVTITFSEAIRASSFTTDDLTVGGGAQLSNLRSTDRGTTWQVTLTAPGNPDPDSTNPGTVRDSTGNRIRVNLAGVVTNRASQAGVGEAVSTVTYDFDARRPTATITLADSGLTAGESTTVTFAFSEPVTGFDASDVNLSNANGTLGPLTANADGRTWTATFTPTANVSDATNAISVNLRGVSDLAGNVGRRTITSANYTVDTRDTSDTTGPTATITLADSALTQGQTTTVTIRFNEPVVGFDASDVVLSDANGTLGPLTPNADNTVWTARFTPTAYVNDSTNTIGVNLAGVTDAAGNAGVGSASSANYSVDTRDTIAPTATVTLDNSALTQRQTATVTIRFSEPVNGFDLSDIDLSNANGTLSPFRHGEDRTVWTTTFTPTAGVVDSTNTISVDLTRVTDDAGNAGVGRAISANYSVGILDITGPTVTIVLFDSVLTAGKTTTVAFVFNEPVNDLDAGDIVLTNANGTLGPLERDEEYGNTWRATFTPTENVNDPTNTISLNLTGVTDGEGNAGVGSATSHNYSVNTVRPTATIALADSALTAGETTTVSFRFSEPVTGFDASDIVCTGGTLSTPTANAERTVWTATFTPTDNVSARTNTIRVHLTGVTNATGNAGTGSAISANYSVDTRTDTTGPTPTITLADSALTAGETTTVTFRFSEPVNGFDASDIVCTSGTLSAPTANAERTVWTATFTPTANVSARENTIRVNLTGVTNAAGNAGTGSASSDNYAVNTQRPTATITLTDTTLTQGETPTVTFRFSEPVNGFTRDDIELSNANGTLGDPVINDDGRTWTALFTPRGNVNDPTNTIRVDLTGVTNAAGNAGTGSASSANYTVNTAGPTATIALSDTTLSVGETMTVTFWFSRPVNGFDSTDIVLTDANGTLSTLSTLSTLTARATAGSYRVWTATFTPTANINDAANTISVNLSGVTDSADNAGTGSVSSDNYSVDTVRPTATITLADNALTAGKTTTVSFRFSEPVNGFDASDIVLTDANGTLGPLTANADGKTWTATFTPTANINDAANTISVNLSGVTDTAGNAGTGSASSDNYSVDTTRSVDTTGPTATITLADNALTAGESTTVSFRFSEPVNGFDASDIVLTDANGTLSAPTANAERTVWTATFTPTANVSALANTIRVNLSGVSDDAGNAGTDSAISTNYSVDTTRPTATITLADNALTVGETTTVSFRFNEPVNGFDASDVVLTDANGTLSPPTANAERTVWTATFTPTANVSVLANTIRVNLAGVRDDAGNAGTGSASSTNYSVDTTRPTATITLADTALTVGESTTVSFRFSEPVTGFDASDVVLTDANGTLSAPTANAERTVWTATFTPTANVSVLANTIRVNLAGVRDDAGNAGTGSASSTNYSVDTTRPTVTITLADNALTVSETTTVSFRFSEPVSGFDASDIVLTDANGTLSPPTANAERTVWTATFTPRANVSVLANTIRVNLSGVRDDAGNTGTGSASSDSYNVDTRPADTSGPTATITLADTALTAGESTTVSFRFNEPVNGFDASDIVLTDANGTLSPPTANAERTVWTATFTPTANVSARANTIRVNLAGVSDDAGNAGTGSASSDNYSVDTVRPTATITLADNALTAGESTTVSFRFNEPVNGFDTSDIVCPSGTLSAPTANAERTVWTATFTPTANVSALANTIRVNLTGVSDDAGNAGTGNAISANYSVDTVRPTATITLADTALTAGESTTVSFRFNEPVTGFDAGDIVLTDANGTLSAPTANAERTVWTATFTPTANVSARANTIRVNLSGVTDDAGNAGTGSASSANYSVHTTRPTATIALADSALSAGESTTVTFTFNEPVNNFDIRDIVCPNGRLSALTENAERTVWTATFTPNANANARTNAIRVDLAGVTNDVGTAGTGRALSTNYSVDTTRPTATITLADSVLTAGESTTVTIRFSEPVTGFDASDIVLTDANGTLSPPTANTERTVWTATFTPTANVSALANTIRVNLAGVRDEAGNAGTGSAISSNYSVDTVRPTATITLADNALTAGETTTVTFRFNETVTGFTHDDIELSDANGTLGPLTADAEGRTWTATFTPTGNVNDASNTIGVNLTGVTNAAGNAGTGTASSDNYTVNTQRPTATITLTDTTLSAGETTTVTFRFSETVNGFTRDDVELSDANGTLGEPTSNDDGRTWTATFTPTANVNDASNTIRVNLTGVTNAAGNAGTGTASSDNYTVNTQRPTATITLADTTLSAGETTTVTFRFSEVTIQPLPTNSIGAPLNAARSASSMPTPCLRAVSR